MKTNIFLKLSLIVLLAFVGNEGLGQSYLGLDGGFEGSATIDNTATGDLLPRASKWVKANTNVTIANETTTVRSGGNSLKVTTPSSSTCRVWSPLITGFSASTTKWVVQYYRRATSTTATAQNQSYNYRGAVETGNGTYSSVSAINTWEKVTYAPTSVLSVTQGAAGILAKMMTSSGDMYYDDFCLYESASGADVAAPGDPGAVTVNGATTSSLDISWIASGSVDGGGYIVVRGTTDPTTAPNTNGIYAVGNTIAAGMTVVYNGTGTSFTDVSLAASTTYYYRVYTYDKAYNYSAAVTGNGTTTGSCSAPNSDASSFSFGSVTDISMSPSWTSGNGSKRIVIARAGSAVSFSPSDNTTYSANSDFSVATDLGSGNKCVYNNTSNTFALTGLTASTTYYFKIYEYNCAAGSEKYYTGGTPLEGNQLTNASCVTSPTITTTVAVNTIATTTASSGGQTLSAGAGCTISAKGVCWKISSGPTISDSKTTDGSGTSDFTSSLSSLSVNTRYYVRAYATNSNGTGYGPEVNFWTLANVPSAPTVNTPTVSTLNVDVNVNSNPASTEFAIQETTTGLYVQADGTLGASPVWATDATWATVTVSGLSSNTNYIFQVKARNGANTETAFSSTANATTLKAEPTNHCTVFICGTTTSTDIPLTWTDAAGGTTPDYYLILWNTSGTFSDPVDGTAQADGAGVKNIAQGVGTYTATGLTQGTTYYFKIFPYSNSGTNVNYKINGTVPTTNCATQTVNACGLEEFNGGTTAPSGWTFTSIGGTYTSAGNYGNASPSLQMNATNDAVETATVTNPTQLTIWIKGQATDGSSALLVEGFNGSWSTIENIVPLPTTGTTKTYNSGTTPALAAGFTKFRFTYTRSAGNLSFDDVNVTCNTCITPSTQASSISFANITSSQMDVSLTIGNGARRVVKINTSNSFTTPTDGSDPTANSVWQNSGEQVVYNNTGSSVTVTGLSASTTYWFRVYEYNCTGALTLYNGATATNNPNSQATIAPQPEINVKQSATNYLTGSTYDFGNSYWGTNSDVVFTIYNLGDQNLTFTSPLTTTSDYSIISQPTSPITPGSNSSFTVRLNPTSTGTKTASVTITNNDADEGSYVINFTSVAKPSNLSDISMTTTGFTYPQNINYLLYPPTADVTFANSLEIGRMRVYDGGTTMSDADNLATIMQSVSFSISNVSYLDRIALYDAVTNVEIAEQDATQPTGFGSLSVTIADNNYKDISIRVTFSTAVVDNDYFRLTAVIPSASSTGSDFISSVSAATSIAGSDNHVVVTATKLLFVQQPSNTGINATMTPAVTVKGADVNNNIDLGFTASVSLSSTGSLTGNPVSSNASSGLATFSSLVHTAAGTGYTMTATSTGLTSAVSNSFDITSIVYVHGDFRALTTGTLTTDGTGTSTWEKYFSGTGWASNADPTSSGDRNIFIPSGITVTMPVGGGNFGNLKIIVLDGGTFNFDNTTVNTAKGILIYGGGTFNYNAKMYMHVDSTFEIKDNGNFYFNWASYSTNQLSTIIWNGTERFHTNSNFFIKDYSGSTNDYFIPSVNDISVYNGGLFGNLIFDPSAETGTFQILPAGFTSGLNRTLTKGDLIFRTTVSSTNVIRFCDADFTITMGGDIIMETGFLRNITVLNSNNTGTVTVNGDLINYSAKEFRLMGSVGTTTVTLNVLGNINIPNAGTFSFNVSSPSANVNSTLNLYGDFAISSSAILRNANISKNAVFNFAGTGDGSTDALTQTIDIATDDALTSENSYINFNTISGSFVQLKTQDLDLGTNSTLTVKNGSTFDFAFNASTPLNVTISGATTGQTFTSETNSTLKITSTEGITTTDGVGNVQVLGANRTFNQTAIFWYYGKNPQTTGNAIITGSTAKKIIADLFTSSHTLTLSNAITTSDKLILKNGIVATDATNLFTIDAGGSVHTDVAGTNAAAGSASSFVNGPIKKIGNTAFTFPTGDVVSGTSKWARIGISAPSNATTEYTAEYIRVGYSDTTTVVNPYKIYYISGIEYWNLVQSADDDVVVKLFWEDAGFSGINDFSANDLRIAHYNGVDWELKIDESNLTGTNVGNIYTTTAQPSFSPFTFASKSATKTINSLPIELLSFNANYNGKSIDLNWSTASETNNDYFTLEKSKNGINFNPFSKVDGAGNSNITLNYSEIDNNPFNGISYYRLKQTDFDGKYSYSNIVSFDFNKDNLIENVWFNNETNQLNININSGNDSEYKIKVYDICGKQLMYKTAYVNDEMILKLNIQYLPSGIYNVVITSTNINFCKKFVIY